MLSAAAESDWSSGDFWYVFFEKVRIYSVDACIFPAVIPLSDRICA
jgi:hypothetical protein